MREESSVEVIAVAASSDIAVATRPLTLMTRVLRIPFSAQNKKPRLFRLGLLVPRDIRSDVSCVG